jgi:hypothetical protein
VFAGAFIQDAPEPVQRLAHGLLVPQPMQYFTTPVTPLDPGALGRPGELPAQHRRHRPAAR